jgi:hypothetical protein
MTETKVHPADALAVELDLSDYEFTAEAKTFLDRLRELLYTASESSMFDCETMGIDDAILVLKLSDIAMNRDDEYLKKFRM